MDTLSCRQWGLYILRIVEMPEAVQGGWREGTVSKVLSFVTAYQMPGYGHGGSLHDRGKICHVAAARTVHCRPMVHKKLIEEVMFIFPNLEGQEVFLLHAKGYHV